MNEEWYYAAANQQQGPVTAAGLAELEKAGQIGAATLVWTQGMSGWEPWGTVAGSVRAEATSATGEEVAVCAYSGRTYPVAQMVPYGDRFVAIEHKEAFIQSLGQGRTLETMAGGTAGVTQFVGFWWRVLSAVIDGTVKFALNFLVAMLAMGVSMGTMTTFNSSVGSNDPSEVLRAMGPMLIVQGALGLIQLAFSIFYDTWMVGKFGGTLGKLALGFRVVNADGSRVTYGRAFGRWAAEVLVKLIWAVPAYLIFIIVVVVAAGAASSKAEGDAFAVGMIVAMIAAGAWALLGGFGYYMAGWTPEKTALHDKMCRTRVIRRVQ